MRTGPCWSAGAAGAVLLLVPPWLLLRADLPWWAAAGWPVVGAAACTAVGRWARRAPRHERVVLEDEWTSGLPPAQALDRLAEHFAAERAGVRREHRRVVVTVGSDLRFRLTGAASARGRRALPAELTVTATDTGSGSVLRARCRDDLGWYARMPAWVPRRAAERTAHLVDAARVLTGAASDRVDRP